MNSETQAQRPEPPNPKTYWFVLRSLTVGIVLFCLGVIVYTLYSAEPDTTNVIHEQAQQYSFVLIGAVVIAYTGLTVLADKIGGWIYPKS